MESGVGGVPEEGDSQPAIGQSGAAKGLYGAWAERWVTFASVQKRRKKSNKANMYR